VTNPTDTEIEDRSVFLFQRFSSEPRKTVIFDLDETLVHCVKRGQETANAHKIMFKLDDGKKVIAPLLVRPYASKVLRRLAKEFEVVVFTAS
jgi:TFIIF-interacting CTD phosphatase-like protein